MTQSIDARTQRVLMIEPTQFRFNPLTASTNLFSNPPWAMASELLRDTSMKEFGALAEAIRLRGIEVNVISGSHDHDTPDAVFPNNWFTTHSTGELVLYPMQAENRRLERRHEIIKLLNGRGYHRLIDLTGFEKQGKFLEGTGSMVLDRANRVAYAGYSSRTHPEPLAEFARWMNYRVVSFHMEGPGHSEIYHTNVMMSVGRDTAVVCLDAIPQRREREAVVSELSRTGREIIELSFHQVRSFCANTLELRTPSGDSFWVMSDTAYAAYSRQQIRAFERVGEIQRASIPLIEQVGGGSVRCMLAELC